MKRFVLLLFVCCLALQCVGQVLKPKQLKLLQSDTYAQINSRTDGTDKKCAVVRFTVVGVDDLKFKEAVGDVAYANNEYIIYLSEGTNVLTCSNKSFERSFNLEDYGPEISSGMTYRFTIDTDNHLRSIVFYVNPTNSKVTVNNQNVSIDQNGKGSINLPIGEYSYDVSAEGYKSNSGTVSLSEDEMYVVRDIVLQEILVPVTLKCNQSDAQVFVDGKNVGQVSSLGDQLMLSKGKHDVRVIKEGFVECSESLSVTDTSLLIDIDLKEIKAKKIVHNEERTKSSISLRSHADWVFGGLTFMDEKFKSGTVKWSGSGTNYVSHFPIKYGISIGATFLSDSIGRKLDNYYDQVVERVTENNESRPKNRLAFFAEIPLQVGFAMPLSRYNTSQINFLGGVYGAYYYIGHGSDSIEDNKAVSTNTFDFGIKVSVIFYFKRFVVNIEGNQSLSKHLGTSVGIGLGWRNFGNKNKR